jgi:prevent-host-death family protein
LLPTCLAGYSEPMLEPNGEPVTYSATEARAQMSRILERVERGEHIAITYRGVPSFVLVDMATFEDVQRLLPNPKRRFAEKHS